ncbi:MAG: DUF4347 domain-containing protein [Magnetococcales bacterium]|nr:DUF4347 domain-containing protein [Magnetococcales bacterium]
MARYRTASAALFLPLEPRMMFDGVGILATPDDDGPRAAPESVAPPARVVELPRPPEASPRREILFIDAAVPDRQTLLAGADPSRQVVLLEPGQDGVARIAAILTSLGGRFDAIHILSHGSAGKVQLGTTSLDADTLDAHAQDLQAWKSALAPQGDILFHGCDVGQGEAGTVFINRVAALTGADVAASDDPTGAASRGGDWILEQTTGAIEAGAPLAAWAQQEYDGLLATITVTSLADNSTVNGLVTLREAISAANNDVSVDGSTAGSGTDTIVFNAGLANGTITLTSSLTLSDNLTIDGGGNNITISGGGGNLRAFYVNMSSAAKTFSVQDLTITNFDPTTASIAGGAICDVVGIVNLDQVTISNCNLANSGWGAAVYVTSNGHLIATDSTFSGNSANKGGAIANSGGTVELTRVTLSGNSSPGSTSSGYGGAIANFSGSTTLDNCTVSGNSSDYLGGGAYLEAGTLTISNATTITGNSGRYGGGIFESAGTLSISDSTIQNNTASPGSGGGIYDSAGTLTISNSTISGNSGASAGGGVLLAGSTGCSATITNTAFNTNTASSGSGGGIYNAGSASILSGSGNTFSGNTGGAYPDFYGPMTFAANDTGSATEAGGTANASAGADATGNVLTNDTNVDANYSFAVSQIRTGSTEGSGTLGTLGTALAGTYGSLTMASTGAYTYAVNNNHASVQALKSGQTLTDSFNCKVTDGTVYDYSVLTITINGANDAPTITSSATLSVAENTTGTIQTASATDPESDTLTWSLSGTDAARFTINSATGALSFATAPDYESPVDSGGDNIYNVTITVADNGTGTLTASQALTVTVTNGNETFSAGNMTGSVTEDGANASGNLLTGVTSETGVGITVTAVRFGATNGVIGSGLAGSYGTLTLDANGNYAYALDNANATVNALPSGGTLTETFDFTVSDGTLTRSAQLTLTIHGANDAPTLVTTLTNQNATQGVPFSYAIPAAAFSDPDSGTSLTCSVAGPAWLTFDASTRTLSGTPANGDVGSALVTVTASDGSGGTVQTVFTMTVANVNDAPTATATPGDLTVREAQAFTHALSAGLFTDPDTGDTLTRSATLSDGSALPGWLSFDAQGLTFSGTPTASGNFTIRVKATDTSGAQAWVDFTIRVEALPTTVSAATSTPAAATVTDGGSGSATSGVGSGAAVGVSAFSTSVASAVSSPFITAATLSTVADAPTSGPTPGNASETPVTANASPASPPVPEAGLGTTSVENRLGELITAKESTDLFGHLSAGSAAMTETPVAVEGFFGGYVEAGQPIRVEGFADSGANERGVSVEGFAGRIDASAPIVVEGFGDQGAQRDGLPAVEGFGDRTMNLHVASREVEEWPADGEQARAGLKPAGKGQATPGDGETAESDSEQPSPSLAREETHGKRPFTAQLRQFGRLGFHQESLMRLKSLLEGRTGVRL